MTSNALNGRTKRAFVAGLALAAAALGMTVPTGPASATAPAASTMSAAAAKGASQGIPTTKTYRQKIPVNVVLVGYDQQEVGDEIVSALPEGSKPIVRYPQYYGLSGRDLGLAFSYDYNVIDTSARFEDRFFGHLARTGVPTDPTTYQQQYNDQANNVLDVTGPVLTIDAPSTEQWLTRRSQSQLGIGKRSYTVFLVNWYGRDDFAFHVYRKTDEPDPDTGVNFGADYNSRAMIAWGGTHGRSWFYDLSAGPEAWTGNWNVDDADVDGDGSADYRMPPIWEYTKQGYRSKYRLASDLGLVVRYVAINLLFTTSPLYDPMVTAPAPGGKLHVPITMFEDNPTDSGTNWIDPQNSLGEWSQLEPYIDLSTALKDVDPIDAGAKKTFRIFAGLNPGDGECWEQYGDTFAQPYCHFDATSGQYYQDVPKNYEAGTFAFFTTPERMGDQAGLLGFADDNWVDGTQSFVFAFDDPETLSYGYGFTTTITHEIGHHLGLSHPHDGYDSESGLDYDSVGDKYYAWSGDESDTIMQYIAVSNGFGQFDRDNMARYQFAGYANWTKALLKAIESAPRVARGPVAGVAAARAQLRLATGAFHRWNYLAAAGAARNAYEIAQRRADALGVGESLRPLTTRLQPSDAAPHEGDPIRFPED